MKPKNPPRSYTYKTRKERFFLHILDDPAPAEAVRGLTDMTSVATDPQGSYTGNPAEGDSTGRPVQDADDL